MNTLRIAIVLALVVLGCGAARAQIAPRLADAPEVAAGFDRIEQYLLKESALSGRLAGLLTLVTAREMNLAYVWSVREDAARAAGLEPAVIDVIRRNEPLGGLSRDDALLIGFGRQLYRNRYVRSETFAASA